ncbi:unnamed protein product [Thelazia callipaeda]|uniref:RRM domain-containing protein n=1 Tax=Thelazia callipaeda TaxID=103827 RepID=A0A0N5D585_THECL|nr:unnamed protein product [Thelazia callipaeda]
MESVSGGLRQIWLLFFLKVLHFQTSDTMSSDEQADKECPLCMEPLEIDDINFYPCKCEYQVRNNVLLYWLESVGGLICRFCWHRLRTDENGLCPACRQPYPEDPVNFKPLSVSDVQKIKTEKRQKQQQQKIKICESRKHLSSYRVLQKNLVYVVGLSTRVADPETLKRPEYFGKFGRILKVAVGTSLSSNGPQSASCTAYVTYARYEDALRAIQVFSYFHPVLEHDQLDKYEAVNNAQLDGRIVKASLGTTKYCTNFLRSQPCHKLECMYLHDVADTEVSFTKDDMHLGRHAEYEKRLIESTLKEKSQRGQTTLANIASGKPANSVERGSAGYITAVGSNEERGDLVQSRSPSGGKCLHKLKNHINGSRLSEWISSSQCVVPLISTSYGSSKGIYIDNKKEGSNNSSPLLGDSSQLKNISSCDWQRALGFSEKTDSLAAESAYTSSSNVQTRVVSKSTRVSVHSDDDLGFDPISESAKGLADLLAEEKTMLPQCSAQNVCNVPSISSSLLSLSLQCGWPSMNNSNGISTLPVKNAHGTNVGLIATNSYSSDNDHFSQPLKLSSQTTQLFTQQPSYHNQYSPHQYFTSPKPQMTRVGSFVSPPNNFTFNSSQPQRCSSFNNSPQFHSNVTTNPACHIDGAKLQEWQEGFRALLPTVNVRFVPDLGNTGLFFTIVASALDQCLYDFAGSLIEKAYLEFYAKLRSQVVGYQPNPTSPVDMQRTASQFPSTPGFDQTVPAPAQVSNPVAVSVPSPMPPVNSQRHPTQHWMTPPPGFSYISK